MNTTFKLGRDVWEIVSQTAGRLTARRVPPASTGADLKACREKLGLNTRDMAERLGISQSKLVKLENGDQWKSLNKVLADARKP
jgi:DNA-binding XRE family transcriptional regulator